MQRKSVIRWVIVILGAAAFILWGSQYRTVARTYGNHDIEKEKDTPGAEFSDGVYRVGFGGGGAGFKPDRTVIEVEAVLEEGAFDFYIDEADLNSSSWKEVFRGHYGIPGSYKDKKVVQIATERTWITFKENTKGILNWSISYQQTNFSYYFSIR